MGPPRRSGGYSPQVGGGGGGVIPFYLYSCCICAIDSDCSLCFKNVQRNARAVIAQIEFIISRAELNATELSYIFKHLDRSASHLLSLRDKSLSER